MINDRGGMAGQDFYEECVREECRALFLKAASEHPLIRLGDSLRVKMLHASPDSFEPRLHEWARDHNLERYEWVKEAARFRVRAATRPDGGLAPIEFDTSHICAPTFAPDESRGRLYRVRKHYGSERNRVL
jgi:hypothetical protein